MLVERATTGLAGLSRFFESEAGKKWEKEHRTGKEMEVSQKHRIYTGVHKAQGRDQTQSKNQKWRKIQGQKMG